MKCSAAFLMESQALFGVVAIGIVLELYTSVQWRYLEQPSCYHASNQFVNWTMSTPTLAFLLKTGIL